MPKKYNKITSIGEPLLIEPSDELDDLRLNALIGKVGIVQQIVYSKKPDRHIVGFWVMLPEAYLDEMEWFIPYPR